MQRVTVTLDDELIAELEHYMKGRDYNNRSEAIRDLARAGMQQAHAELSGTAECVAALVYVYDHTVRELANRLAEAHHHHHDLSVAAMQVHLDHSSCMEVALLRGDTREVNHFAENVTAERGVRHGRLVAIPVEVKEEAHPHGNDRAKKHPGDRACLRMCEHRRRLHAESGCDDRGDLPTRRGSLPRRLFPPTRFGTLRAAPFRKKTLQVRIASSVATMPDVVEQTATDLVAVRPALGEKILEIEQRTRFQRQSTTMR